MPSRLNSGELLLTLTSRGPIRCRRQVVVVHDVFVLEHPEWFSRSYALTHRPVLRQQLSSAAALIAVSEATARALERHVSGRQPIGVAPNAPASVFLEIPLGGHQDDRRTLASHHLEPGKYFLCVGSQDPRKNLGTLVSAHLRLPESIRREYPLVVVGAGGTAFADLDITEDPSIRRLGYVSDADLSVLYGQASGVLFASLDEGFGLPLAEALAAGAPLLVSDIEVFRWVAGDHAEYISPKDVVAWSAAMRGSLDVSQTTAAERSARRQWIGSRFSWESSAQAIMDVVSAL